MKKKIVFLGAALAALTAFNSCSNEEDLVQVVEKPAGVPMVFSVVDNATRGTDLTKSTLEGFTAYSTMKTSWQAGVDFTCDDGACTSLGDLTWPDESSTSYTFYSISDKANLAKDAQGHTLIPTVTEGTVSFGYKIPTTYTAQQDLLVAKSTGSATGGDPAGTVEVEFDHALAQIKAIKLYCNINNVTNSGDKVNYRFRIKGIRLGGLKAVGTYTFDAVTPWAVSGDDEVFEVPLKEDELSFTTASFKPGTKTTDAITLPLTDEGLYLIPQTAAGAIASVGSSYEVENAYAELDAQVFFYSDFENTPGDGGAYRVGENLWNGFDWNQTSSDDVGFGKIRVPLKFTIAAGKGYTLVLDISRAVIYENEGSETGTAVSEPIFAGATIVVG